MGATYVYNLNFFVGFIASAGVYYGICRLSPPPGMIHSGGWHEPVSFEPEDMVRLDDEGVTPTMVYAGSDKLSKGESDEDIEK